MRNVKTACLLLAVFLLLAPGMALAQSAVVNSGTSPSDGLNLRSEPSREAASLGRFVSGTRVEIVADAGGGWSKVIIGGGSGSVAGYMMTEYLSGAAAADARTSRQVTSPYGTPSVVLRDRASNSCGAVAMLTVGETVTVIGYAGDFCYVQTADLSVGCLLKNELK